MSELTDLFIQVGEQVGWDFILLLTFAYELFWPRKLWETRLRGELRQPSEGVIAALEAVYDEHDGLSKEKLVDTLNGDAPRAWEFSEEDIKEHRGG